MSLLLSLGICSSPPPQLQLSNIEEVLVYFCLLLESELAAGSDSHSDQAGMCSSQSDQTTVGLAQAYLLAIAV